MVNNAAIAKGNGVTFAVANGAANAFASVTVVAKGNGAEVAIASAVAVINLVVVFNDITVAVVNVAAVAVVNNDAAVLMTDQSSTRVGFMKDERQLKQTNFFKFELDFAL